HSGARPAEVAEHGRADDVWRTDENFAFGFTGFVAFVGRKFLAELLVDLCELVGAAMEREREAGFGEAAKQFLAFAQGVAEQHGRFVTVERFLAKADDAPKHFGGGRETILRSPEGRFHD